MNFSQYAGSAIVPTLSRIVLCAAFVTAGYNKLFVDDHGYSADQATRLKQLGVQVRPAPAVASKPQDAAQRWRNVLATIQDTIGETSVPGNAAGANTADQGDAVVYQIESGSAQTQPADEAGAEPEATQPAALPPGNYSAKGMHRVTLLLDDQTWPQPVALAIVLACTELIGGALLLVGLFSRIWGLGLAIAMGAAIYLTALPVIEKVGLWDLAIPDYNRLYCQAGLFVLAFGILLTGAGPLSLDRFLFGRSERIDEPPPEPAKLEGPLNRPLNRGSA